MSVVRSSVVRYPPAGSLRRQPVARSWLATRSLTPFCPGRRAACAQDTTAEPAKAAGVFDDEKKKDEEKPADADEAADAPGSASDRDTIGFTQENVSAQMTELEERMFRLSEALASLEPENASRLRLALKFSREELILGQMKETQKLLKDAQLSKAETEVRELLAKLEHLRRLLLAEDLDFQMKLARLRQMRETLGQLERIINEEKRELSWSRKAVERPGRAGEAAGPQGRPGGARPRPEGRGRRHDGRGQEGGRMRRRKRHGRQCAIARTPSARKRPQLAADPVRSPASSRST